MGRAQSRPIPDNQPSKATSHAACISNYTRRRGASRRLPVLSTGRADPWRWQPVSVGYAAAAAHLIELGLIPAPNVDALRAMWRVGGYHRQTAEVIAERWGMTA